jgi:TRAP-type C4-dicarboxylate transport system permease large subunit
MPIKRTVSPVLSTIEDVTSVGLVFIAILIPALVLVILLALAWAAVSLLRRRRRRKAARADTNAPGTPPGTN